LGIVLVLTFRKMNPHPSQTAMWRIVLAILASSQNFGLRSPNFYREAVIHYPNSTSKDGMMSDGLMEKESEIWREFNP
jgi:hypothetical protein